MLQDKAVYSSKDEALYDIASNLENQADNLQEIIKNLTANMINSVEIIEAVRKNNPKYESWTLEQLSKSEEFQKDLKEYISQHITLPTESSTPEEIKALHSIIPENIYITNNKLSNELTRNFAQKGTITLGVINPNKKGEIVTYNSLTYEGKDISITGKYEFTAYDRAIHNAVCSLYAAGNEIVTPRMVYRAVNGMSDNEKVSPQSMEAVINSLDKSRFMRLKVDFTNEAKARGWSVDKTEIDSYLLPAESVIVEAGGHKTLAYKILKIPELYKYSQLTKQIISIPLGLLDTKEATRNTEEIISIKEYLIRRIEIMKHDKDMSNKILYDTIFEEASIVIKRYTERDRYRKYIKDILSLWETRDSYIKNFKEYTVGKSYKGIEIML
jgi:hypothetical protein